MYRVRSASLRSAPAGIPGVADTARRGRFRRVRSDAGVRGTGLVEVVVTLPQPPLAEAILHDRGLAALTTTPPAPERPRAGKRLLSPNARNGATPASGPDRSRDPDCRGALALRRRPQRDGRRRSEVAARKAHRAARSDGLAERHLPRPSQSHTAADRRSNHLGPDSLDRRQRHEDRHTRRRARPDARLLRSGGLLLPTGLSEGEHRVHDGEGDRREDVRSEDARVEVREHAL